MIRDVGFALALCALGCAAPAPRQAVHAGHATSRAPASSWTRYMLELAGLDAEFPEPPTELATDRPVEGTSVRVDALALERKKTFYACGHARAPGRDRMVDQKVLPSYVKLFAGDRASASPTEAHGFRGLNAEGIKDGKTTLVRVFSVGDGAVYALAQAPRGQLDRALAARFLEHCDFSIPWRVYASPEGAYTVAVPAFAIEVDTGPKLGVEGGIGRMFFLGGKNDLSYIVASSPLARENFEGASDDDILERISALITQGARVTWSAPVEIDGARGRDLIWSKDGLFVRWRVLLTRLRMFQLGINTRSEGQLRDDLALRFLSSLQRISDD